MNNSANEGCYERAFIAANEGSYERAWIPTNEWQLWEGLINKPVQNYERAWITTNKGSYERAWITRTHACNNSLEQTRPSGRSRWSAICTLPWRADVLDRWDPNCWTCWIAAQHRCRTDTQPHEGKHPNPAYLQNTISSLMSICMNLNNTPTIMSSSLKDIFSKPKIALC